MQAKHTFTQVPNSLLETRYTSKLTASELRVMLFIIRRTAGYHRRSHELSAGFIARGTGLNLRTVKRVLKQLWQYRTEIVPKMRSRFFRQSA